MLDLRDGTPARIRAIIPADAPGIARGFERLSPESRRQRFLTAINRLTSRQLDYLSHPDLTDHLALGMEVLPADGAPSFGIGVARCVRLSDHGDLAEVAVVVADEWQRRGVATLLLEQLAAWARARGIRLWLGVMLGTNEAAQRLMRKIAPVVERRPTVHGIAEVVYDLHARVVD